MIESTTTTPPAGVTIGMSYLAGSRLAVIRIDGAKVGEATFIDSQSLEQFMSMFARVSVHTAC